MFKTYEEFRLAMIKKYNISVHWMCQQAWDHQQEVINVLRAEIKVNPQADRLLFSLWKDEGLKLLMRPDQVRRLDQHFKDKPKRTFIELTDLLMELSKEENCDITMHFPTGALTVKGPVK